jgi:hypothetical protein
MNERLMLQLDWIPSEFSSLEEATKRDPACIARDLKPPVRPLLGISTASFTYQNVVS